VESSAINRKPGLIGLIAIGLVFLAVFIRTFTLEMPGALLIRYLGIEIGYLVLLLLALWKPGFPPWLIHLFFVVQSAVVLWLLSLWPNYDFVVVLYFLLSYAAALFFRGLACWTWIFIIVALTGGSLIYFHGFLHGLALSLTTMAGEIVIPAYVLVNQETEAAKMNSQNLLTELSRTNRQLKQYAGQVEALAAFQERNRLAGTLHDSVSQTLFSISLTARAVASLIEKDPTRARAEIDRLQTLTAGALSQLRSLITEMRAPK
jgi:signal transduction histidine kinase